MEKNFGKYDLLYQIGVGGMAEIWLAKESGLHGFERLVVIKKILPFYSLNQNFKNMFFDEAKIIAQINHQNIVQIFDFGLENDSYYLAMEFIFGADLEKILVTLEKTEQKFPLEYAIYIVLEAAKGLHHTHIQKDIYGKPLNIVHRDVSPQNIMVGYGGAVKVLDFGVAKAASQSSTTNSSVVKGKVCYMSPEQVKNEVIDHRSDIFSLGILLYETTTGKRLFRGNNPLRVMKKIIDEPIEKPEDIIKNFPKQLSKIILKSLERDPEKRYQNGLQFIEDLEQYFLMIKSSTANISQKISKWIQKIFKDDIDRFNEKKGEILRELNQTGIENPFVSINMSEVSNSLDALISRTDEYKAFEEESSEEQAGNLDIDKEGLETLFSYIGTIMSEPLDTPTTASYINNKELENISKTELINVDTTLKGEKKDEVAEFLQKKGGQVSNSSNKNILTISIVTFVLLGIIFFLMKIILNF